MASPRSKSKHDKSTFFQVASCLLPQSATRAEYKKMTYSSHEESMRTVLPSLSSETQSFDEYYEHLSLFCSSLNSLEHAKRQSELHRLCDWLNNFVPFCDHSGQAIYVQTGTYSYIPEGKMEWHVWTRGSKFNKPLGPDHRYEKCDELSLIGFSLVAPRYQAEDYGTDTAKFDANKSHRVLTPIFERLKALGLSICIDTKHSHYYNVHITNEEFLKSMVDNKDAKYDLVPYRSYGDVLIPHAEKQEPAQSWCVIM